MEIDSSKIVTRHAMGAGGNSGAILEKVVLADGGALVHKRVHPDSDWMARVAGDDGHVVAWWADGVFARMPRTVDSSMEAVERTPDGGWEIYMRDVSAALGRVEGSVGSSERLGIFTALRDFHAMDPPSSDVTRGCPLEARYTMFSAETAEAERRLGNPHGDIIGRGWETFVDEVSPDLAETVLALGTAPNRLAQSLATFHGGVVHGDVRLGNLGLSDRAVVLIDWGERLGLAPPAVDLAWLVGFDGYRLGDHPDAILEELQAIYGPALEARSMEIALLGAVVQLGGIIGHWIAAAATDDEQGRYQAHLAWLVTRAADALSHW